jgi:hypothetical protein
MLIVYGVNVYSVPKIISLNVLVCVIGVEGVHRFKKLKLYGI